jgi:WD40 repeat protein
MKWLRWWILSALLLLSTLAAAPAHPPLVAEGEKFEDIKDFEIGSGHKSTVTSVAFAPDGKYIVSGSSDNSIKLWSVETKELLYTFEGHSNWVNSVSFSGDGRFIVSGSSDRSVKLWSVEERRLLYTFEGHSDGVYSVSISRDGRFIISGSYDKSVKLWSVEERRLIDTFEGHSGGVYSVSISRDGRFIVSGSTDKSVKLWSVEERRLLHTFEGHSGGVSSVSISRDGRFIVSGSWDKSVKLWSVEERRLLHTFEGHSDSVISVSISGDGRFIVSGSYDNSVKLWSVEKRRLIESFEGHSGSVSSVSFSRDGRFIVSGSSDKSVKLWSVDDNKLLYLYKHSGSVNSVVFSPDSQYIVSGSADNSVKLWSVKDKRILYIYKHSSSVNSVAFSPDSQYFVSGSATGSLKFWSVRNTKLLYSLDGNLSSVKSVTFSHNGNYLVAGSGHGNLELWSVKDKKLLYTFFDEYDSYVNAVAFSPNDKYIVSGSGDRFSIYNNVKLWSVKDKKLLHSFTGHNADVSSVSFSSDGKYIISGSWDINIKLWSVENKKLLYTFEGHTGNVNSVAFSSDGRYIVSGSADNSVKLWDIQGKALQEDIYAIGSNWTWFNNRDKNLTRFDNGNLVMKGDKPLRPKDCTNSDNLKIEIPKELRLFTQQSSVIKVKITNQDKNSSYWIGAVSDTSDIIVYPNQIIKLKPSETKTLDINISASLPVLNRKPFSKKVKLKFVTANGYYTTKEILVHYKTPQMEVKEAKYDSQNKVLIVEIVNSGEESINDLNIKIGDDIQQIKKLNINQTVTKSFIFQKDINKSNIMEVLIDKIKELLPFINEVPEANITISKPFYEWQLNTKVTPMISAYIVLALLILILAIAIYYYRLYRHPLLLELERSHNRLDSMELTQLPKLIELLIKTKRLEDILELNRISLAKLEQIAAYTQAREGVEKAFCTITGMKYVDGMVELPNDFALNLRSLMIDGSGDSQRLRKTNDKRLAVTNDAVSQDALAKIAQDRANLLVSPSWQQLTKMLFSRDIYGDLTRLLSTNLSLKDISPYQIASGVKKSSMFFGRTDIISNIINKEPHNYIIVGARQLGKSSLLSELKRRYEERGRRVYYITLDEESDLIFHLSYALGVDRDTQSIQKAIYSSSEPIIFLIDEVDKFLLLSKNSEKFTSIFRSLAQEGRAYFILAGFWELYQETLQAKSPLRNFGDIIRLDGLETEACREMITKPMELMGIGYESDAIVEKIIAKSGRRTNLIAVICHRLLSNLEGRVIKEEDLNKVLADGFVEYIALSQDKLERVIEYATIQKPSFYQEDIYEVFDRFDVRVDTADIERALQRLELSYVLVFSSGQYRYQVPLFVDKVMESTKNFDLMLKREMAQLSKGSTSV